MSTYKKTNASNHEYHIGAFLVSHSITCNIHSVLSKQEKWVFVVASTQNHINAIWNTHISDSLKNIYLEPLVLPILPTQLCDRSVCYTCLLCVPNTAVAGNESPPSVCGRSTGTGLIVVWEWEINWWSSPMRPNELPSTYWEPCVENIIDFCLNAYSQLPTLRMKRKFCREKCWFYSSTSTPSSPLTRADV